MTVHLDRLGAGIENATIEDVRRVLRDALSKGLDHAATRDALGSLFDGYADWRLDRISLTETTAAYNLGAIGQYRDAGVQMVKVIDGDDPLCSDANGAEWTLEQAENEPLGHPNCRRTWIPLTDTLLPPNAVIDAAPTPRVSKVRIVRDEDGSLSITEETDVIPGAIDTDETERLLGQVVNKLGAIERKDGVVNVTVRTPDVHVDGPQIDVHIPEQKPMRRIATRDAKGRITGFTEEPDGK